MNRHSPNLSHFGIYVHELELMVAFYTQVFDLTVTDRGMGQTLRNELVFLSGNPEHHHQLVLAGGRPSDAKFSTVMQLSFLVGTIADLRTVRDKALAAGASNLTSLTHGTALSIYFDDPEKNRVEVYYETPFYISQPFGRPFDLDEPDEEILRDTEALCRRERSFMLLADWRRRFSASRA